jgi:hypothetical protein
LQRHTVFDVHSTVMEEHAASIFRAAAAWMRILQRIWKLKTVVWDNRNNANDNDWVDFVNRTDIIGSWIVLSVQWLSYRLDNLGFKSQQRQEFLSPPKCSYCLWGPPSLLASGHQVSLPEVNSPRHEGDHSPHLLPS